MGFFRLAKIFVFIGFSYLVKSKNVFMPNLPLGEYRTVIEKIYPCESLNSLQTIKTNLYFNKRTSNITEMKGNFTFLVPFDDSLTLDVNAASWSLIGGWKPNSMVYISKTACSSLKKILGNAWYSLMKAFNFSKATCPIPLGIYVTSGLDFKEIEDHNFPKVYFYGKYKTTVKIKNVKNDVLGCIILELSLIRPWEKPI
ncbi:uncharacterized protein LOC113557827 [Rhopalosiphum maidis]|uniref:uncharacterized protein LOC113557827 n=1 Tax=Rhopalosiphum maidis TaxID=43146 RepID=UPI00101C6660|nr:uncharacterized protein LOC113557827 [Rhopalosiphum maidis]